MRGKLTYGLLSEGDVSWWGASSFLSFCLLFVCLLSFCLFVKRPVWEWMKGKWTYGQDDSSWWGAFRFFLLFVFLWRCLSGNEWKENELMVRMIVVDEAPPGWQVSLCPVCPVQNWSLSTKSPLSGYSQVSNTQTQKYVQIYKYIMPSTELVQRALEDL